MTTPVDAPVAESSRVPSQADLAIRAMRRIETRISDAGRRRAQLMEEYRRVLDATSMALCHIRNDGDLSLASVAGVPPNTAMVQDIIARVSRRSRDWFSFTKHNVSEDVVLAGRGTDVLYAVVPPGSESWIEDFVAIVAERFIHPSSKSGERNDLSALTSDLVLPGEMIVGPSGAMRALLDQIVATVSSRLDVMLSGETGTGKELLAHVVHDSGPTRGGPFVAVNCAAIPNELLEAELFGVERHVATGVDPRTGLFLEADGGSMFLDEIAELPERLQAKLLRVLQEREVLPLGAKRPQKISVRILSASNRDLAGLVAARAFRADLYYRLRGLEFHAPPLRERKEDIPMLALEFLARASEEYGKRIAGITSAALDVLSAYAWPGNVRQLQSEIRRAALLCFDGASLEEKHFPSLTMEPLLPQMSATPSAAEIHVPLTLRGRLDAVERVEIERALIASRGNRSAAARMLGITRNGLNSKLRRYGIEVPQ